MSRYKLIINILITLLATVFLFIWFLYAASAHNVPKDNVNFFRNIFIALIIILLIFNLIIKRKF